MFENWIVMNILITSKNYNRNTKKFIWAWPYSTRNWCGHHIFRFWITAPQISDFRWTSDAPIYQTYLRLERREYTIEPGCKKSFQQVNAWTPLRPLHWFMTVSRFLWCMYRKSSRKIAPVNTTLNDLQEQPDLLKLPKQTRDFMSYSKLAKVD